MKRLLENDMPLYYGVGRRKTATEIRTVGTEFDLIDAYNDYVVPTSTGTVTLTNNVMELSIINYEHYLNQFTGTQMSDGRNRCDFIICDVVSDKLFMLCEITSSLGDTSGLSLPIPGHVRKSDGVLVGAYTGGKYEKAEAQLSGTLETIVPVPTIDVFIKSKQSLVCLMAYRIIPRTDETASVTNAFNRPMMMEADEAGESGAEVPCKSIEKFGFKYYRISHNFKFAL